MTPKNICVKPKILGGHPKLVVGSREYVLQDTRGARRADGHLSSIEDQNGCFAIGAGGALIRENDGLLSSNQVKICPRQRGKRKRYFICHQLVGSRSLGRSGAKVDWAMF